MLEIGRLFGQCAPQHAGAKPDVSVSPVRARSRRAADPVMETTNPNQTEPCSITGIHGAPGIHSKTAIHKLVFTTWCEAGRRVSCWVDGDSGKSVTPNATHVVPYPVRANASGTQPGRSECGRMATRGHYGISHDGAFSYLCVRRRIAGEPRFATTARVWTPASGSHGMVRSLAYVSSARRAGQGSPATTARVWTLTRGRARHGANTRLCV